MSVLRYRPNFRRPPEASAYEVKEWFDAPSVIPFLGTDCGRVGLEESPAWGEIFARVDELESVIDEPIQRFLSSLLSRRNAPKKGAVLAVGQPKEPYAVLTLASAVAELAWRATQLLALTIDQFDYVIDDWASNATPWLDVSDESRLPEHLKKQLGIASESDDFNEQEHAVPTGRLLEDSQVAEFVIVHRRALDASEALRSETADARGRDLAGTRAGQLLGPNDWLWQLLGIDGIHDSLVELGARTLRGPDNAKIGVRLTGQDAGWLTALLWHCIRYDQPICHSANELAFQLSLTCWPKAPEGRPVIVRPDLSLATQNAERSHIVAERLAWAIERATHPSGQAPSNRELYEVIAAIAWEHASSFRRKRSVPKPNDHEYQPVVFSTTFDRELERSLLRTSLGAHERITVFVPVMVIPNTLGAGRAAHFRWVYSTFASRPSSDISLDELLDSPEWKWAPGHGADLEWPEEAGVSIVKVNGAPLYRDLEGSTINEHYELAAALGRDDGGFALHGSEHAVDGNAVIRHALVLSEFELLRAVRLEMQSDDALDFIEALRREAVAVTGPPASRRVAFIGHPITEWLTRVRILTRFCNPAIGREADLADPAASGNVFFGSGEDLLQASLLAWADIDPRECELGWLVDTLRTSGAYARRVSQKDAER